MPRQSKEELIAEAKELQLQFAEDIAYNDLAKLVSDAKQLTAKDSFDTATNQTSNNEEIPNPEDELKQMEYAELQEQVKFLTSELANKDKEFEELKSKYEKEAEEKTNYSEKEQGILDQIKYKLETMENHNMHVVKEDIFKLIKGIE